MRGPHVIMVLISLHTGRNRSVLVGLQHLISSPCFLHVLNHWMNLRLQRVWNMKCDWYVIRDVFINSGQERNKGVKDVVFNRLKQTRFFLCMSMYEPYALGMISLLTYGNSSSSNAGDTKTQDPPYPTGQTQQGERGEENDKSPESDTGCSPPKGMLIDVNTSNESKNFFWDKKVL